MAKKDFNNLAKQETKNDVKEITKSLFSNDTLKKIEKVNEEEKIDKRVYNKFKKDKDIRDSIVSLRFTREEREQLEELAINNECDNISQYIRKLLKREGLK